MPFDFMNYISKPFAAGQVQCTSDARHLFSSLPWNHDTASDIDSHSSYSFQYDDDTDYDESDDEEDDYAF